MPIPGVTPFAGQLPDEGEPSTFPARAEALFDWLTINAAPEIDAVADGINAALNDNGTVLDTAGRAIAITRNANTIVPTGGTGNAYTITPAVGISAYQEGDTFLIRPDRANTGATTLKVGILAAVAVRKPSTSGSGFVELAAGDWQANDVHLVAFRDGQFELLTIPLQAFVRNDTPQTVTAAWNFAGALGFANAAQVLSALGIAATAGSPTVLRIGNVRIQIGGGTSNGSGALAVTWATAFASTPFVLATPNINGSALVTSSFTSATSTVLTTYNPATGIVLPTVGVNYIAIGPHA